MKILFITKNISDYCGVTKGLQNSAFYVVHALTKLGYEAKLVLVEDANSIDREVHRYKPTICILEAIFATVPKVKEILELHPKVDFIIRLHSTFGFLAIEGNAIDWLLRYRELNLSNLYISSNNREFNNELSEVLGVDSIYLPNIYYPLDRVDHERIHKEHSDFIDVSCFGSIRILKNQLEQAVSSIIFANRIGKYLRFHINSGRCEDQGNNCLKNLRGLFSRKDSYHELIEYPWMDRDSLLESFRWIDIALQVSYVESFNLTVADGIKCGIPSVVSPAINWLPKLVQADPNSAEDIVKKMEYCYYKPKEVHHLESQALQKYNTEAVKVWGEFLEEYR